MSVRRLKVLDLFSGIGGISLGLESTGGFETVAFCEIEPFPREVLAQHWPEVPIYGDVRKLSASEFPTGIDAIVGGFPCQPFSVAGKQKAQADERHLWPEFARLIRELRPRWVLAENVPGIRTLAADEVLADLEAAGYSCWPLVVGADDVGAPHRRKRVWFVAQLRLADRDSERERDADQLRGIEREGGAGTPDAGGGGDALAHSNAAGQPAERSGGLFDGELADTERSTGERWPRRQELLDHRQETGRVEGERRSLGHGQAWPARPGEPQHEWEEPRLAHAFSRSDRPETGGDEAGGPDSTGPTGRTGRSGNGAAGASADDQRLWAFVDEHGREVSDDSMPGWLRDFLRGSDVPRPGEPQHELEEPRLSRVGHPEQSRADAQSAPGGSRDAIGESGPGRPQLPVGASTDGLPLDLVRLARRGNREALKAAGNSVVPQVVAAIGRAILKAEMEVHG